MARRWLAWSATLGACVVVVAGCVRGGPLRSPDGGGTTDAQMLDAGAPPSDAEPPPIDAPITTPEDGGTTPPPVDAGFDAGTDAYVPPPVDGGPPPGTRAYLDRCTADAECVSGRCVPDLGGTRYCTRTCTIESQCADEHLCVGGICVPDDTGKTCASGDACSTTLCLGTGSDGQCTRDCANAADCPAGYACTTFDGTPTGRRVCIDIEKPCTAGGTECRSTLCHPTLGCSAYCRTAADCPSRLAIPELAPYQCVDGMCIPASDVIGSDPIGAFCSPTGNVYCRSGLCASDAAPSPMCSQGCTSTGNCAPGYGCVPDQIQVDPVTTRIAMACLRAGTGDLGAGCNSGRECESAICLPPGGGGFDGRCSRLCMDSICPTGWTCTPYATGSSIRICVPPG